MRHFCTLAAATSLILAGASAANAAILHDDFVFADNITATLLNNGNLVEIDGFGSFSVFFNQDADDSRTSFNDVFGSETTPKGVTFSQEFADAAISALRPLVAPDPINNSARDFFPGVGNKAVSWLPFGVGQSGEEMDANVLFDSVNNDGESRVLNGFSRSFEFDPEIGFLTFREASAPDSPSTEVPTPALIPGLIGMGIAALRKRNLAQPDEA